MNRVRFLSVAAVFALWISANPATLLAANNIKIISGNGQLLKPLYTSFLPMVVQVVNEAGVPQPSVTVNWNVTSAAGIGTLIGGSSTTTGSDGTTSNTFIFTGGVLATGNPFQRIASSTITASTTDSTATFNLSAVLADFSNPQGSISDPFTVEASTFVQGLFAGAILSGQAGTTGSDPIRMRFSTLGVAVPNVSLQLVSYSDPSVGPAVTCAESQGGTNMVLSDATGFATCTPLFSGTPGTGKFYMLIGAGGIALTDPTQPPLSAYVKGDNSNITVTAATAGSIKITQGNSQSGSAGQALPTQLQVEVDSTSGAPIAGQQVRWTATPASAVNFSSSATTTDITGKTAVMATFSGAASGAVQVTASVIGTNLTQTFNLTAVPLVSITGFTIFSGNNQSTPVSTAFPQPLVVQVTASSGTASNVTVQFQATGSVTLSSNSATTDANGRAQVTATAGTVTGPASVTASIASNTGVGSQTFNLTVLPPAPVITAANFVNGADQQANSLSPCSLGSIVAGANALGIANIGATFPGQPVATTARLTINNVTAPILQVANNSLGQQVVLFQVPCETAAGSSVPSTVTVGGGNTNINLNIQAASPGIFQSAGSDGTARAVVVRPDGSFASITNPARRGENVSIFATGLGATSPPVGTGSVPPSGTAANVQGTVIVGMAGGGVPLVSAKLTEDLPGVYLVTFTIPSDMQTGNNVVASIAVIPPGSSNPIYSAGTRIPVQ